MKFEEYRKHDALSLGDMVRRREVSPKELMDSALDAIERINPAVNCMVQTLPEHAMAEIDAGVSPGPFKGVPFLIKELGMHFKGMKSAFGSRMVNFTHEFDTELMLRFRKAGLVTLGTTTTPELGLNPNSEALVYGSTRNPWNLEYSAGGSSGGSSAAVAAGIVPIAHGNDGGGSIRFPAACNGLVGMKTTRGRTPTGPAIGMWLWGLSVEFALTRTVRDSAAALDAVHGSDAGYFYNALPPEGSFLAAAMRPPGQLRIGVMEQMPGAGKPNAEVTARLNDTRALLESLGHICEPVMLPYDQEEFAESTLRLWSAGLGYYITQFEQMTGKKAGLDNLEAMTLEFYKYGCELKAMDMEWAMSAQNTVCRAVGQVMEKYDVLLSPMLVRDVAKLGEHDQDARGMSINDFWKHITSDYGPYTSVFNTTGQPAMSLPLWQSEAGLPMGIQFVGRLGKEETLYSLAGQLEEALPWADRRPTIGLD